MGNREKIPKLDSSYDVVVIGAGNGGLAAGLMLAVKGVKPLVLEQHNVPGGFATSFVRGRFEFEASLHELCSIGPASNKGGVRKFLEDECGVDIDWVSIPDAYRLILTNDGTDIRLPFGEKAFVDTIADAVPGSRAPLEKYMALCRDITTSIGYLVQMQNPKKMLTSITDFIKTSANPLKESTQAAIQLGNFFKTLPYSVDKVTEKFNIPQKALDILYPYWCYLGIPMSRLNFTIWAGMLLEYLDHGAYIPRLRSQEMTVAMEARIRELGGRVEYNTRVEGILVKDGKVTGVETSAGDRIQTSRVLSNASPTLTYNKLISPQSEAPEIAFRNVNSRKLGATALVVYLGLDGSPEELGIEDYGFFISDTMNTEKVYDSLFRLGLTDMQATTCQNIPIPDCSPPGTTILSITTLYKCEAWENVKPMEYFKIKNEIAGAMIDQFEKATGTAIRDRIEEIEIATPVTFARYTGAFCGGIYGYELDPWDCVIPRILAEKQEKYIEGLDFVGGFASFGSGYSSSLDSGRAVALNTLREMGGK